MTSAAPAITPADAAFMQQALALALLARPHCPPNPAVGCVLAAPGGQVIGQGHTQPAGQAHAEIMALRHAAAQGHATAGATAYVTLEPCSHHGRTGPCCDALIAAGLRRVVLAVQDPNPHVAGQGIARLRAAGLQVDLCPGPPAAQGAASHAFAQQVRALNIGFFSRMLRQQPWVRLKTACSLDGRTALPNGASQWITSPEARADNQHWRARACAILTGAGTVLADDPQLNVRLSGHSRQPTLYILDSRLRTPAQARLWAVPGRRVCIVTDEADPARHQPLRQRGADILVLPGPQGRIHLPALLAEMARREINELHVEAGARLNASLLAQRLADEVLLYQAPLLLGEGHGLAALGPFTQIAQAPRLQAHTPPQPIGPDWRSQWLVADKPSF